MSGLAGRVHALESLFREVERTRMAGVPLLHRALRVEAVGFERVDDPADDAPAALGVLLTPWFMNLVWLPLRPVAGRRGVGVARERAVGDARFEFIEAVEPGLGAYEACSLASPMFEFADQAAARATALAVLATLRASAPPASRGRRGFLLGRSAAQARA